MKTRNSIYAKEAAELIRSVSMYKALRSEQIYRMFPGKETSIRNLIGVLIKQKRIYYNPDTQLISISEDTDEEFDKMTIAAFWVLLDFYDRIDFHTSSDYPVKLSFFSDGEFYEIIYVQPEKEVLINHAFDIHADEPGSRLVIVESGMQIDKINIPSTTCYCTVAEDGGVEYYKLE